MFTLNAFWQINYQSHGYGIRHSHQEHVNTTSQKVNFPFIIKLRGSQNHLHPLLHPHLSG